MKYILLITALLIGGIELNAQKEEEKIILPTFVILANGDSIAPVDFKNNIKSTNEFKITYKERGKQQVKQADEIKSYFNGRRYYSVLVFPEQEYRLISINVHQSVKLGMSANRKKGKSNYYVFYDDKWHSLKGYKWDLKSYFLENLKDFEKSGIDGTIHYDLKSLGNALRRYNEFISPSGKKNLTPYKYPDHFHFGLYAGVGMSSLGVQDDYPTTFDGHTGAVFGLQGYIQYSRLLGILFQLEYQNRKFEKNTESVSLNAGRVHTDLMAKVFSHKDNLIIRLGGGLSINAIFDGELVRPESVAQTQRIVNVAPFSIGLNAKLMIEVKSGFGLMVGYHLLPNIKSESIDFLTEKNVKFSASDIQFSVYKNF